MCAAASNGSVGVNTAMHPPVSFQLQPCGISFSQLSNPFIERESFRQNLSFRIRELPKDRLIDLRLARLCEVFWFSAILGDESGSDLLA
jgi:hypothetical protein